MIPEQVRGRSKSRFNIYKIVSLTFFEFSYLTPRLKRLKLQVETTNGRFTGVCLANGMDTETIE